MAPEAQQETDAYLRFKYLQEHPILSGVSLPEARAATRVKRERDRRLKTRMFDQLG